jgi:hypothetical protein
MGLSTSAGFDYSTGPGENAAIHHAARAVSTYQRSASDDCLDCCNRDLSAGKAKGSMQFLNPNVQL